MDYHAEVPATPETSEHSRARLLAALLDTHHVTFYTVISVIQATCFGFLALVCFEEGKHFAPSQWLLAANTLIIFVLVLEWVHQRIRHLVIRAEARRRRDAVCAWCRPVFCHLFCRSWCAWLVLEHGGAVLHRFSGIHQRRGQRETEPDGKCAHHGVLWEAPSHVTDLEPVSGPLVRGNRLCSQLVG